MLLEEKTMKVSEPEEAKISVIIVTYNAAETLQSCLDSIYRQKYPAIEITVIDGKSTDGTVKILQENSDRIYYWKSEEDAGVYDAMNKALKYATGDWIYFLGADDVLFDDFTSFASELKQQDTIYYGRVLCLGGPTIPVNAYSFAKYGICHQAMIYPKTVFEKNNFSAKYKISADYALNMALFNSEAFHFAFKDYLIAKFNHTGMSSVSIDKAFENDRPGLVLKYFGFKIWMRFMFWRLKNTAKRKDSNKLVI
jgi:glycosyltransferase involved in cell wall biosynthesis